MVVLPVWGLIGDSAGPPFHQPPGDALIVRRDPVSANRLDQVIRAHARKQESARNADGGRRLKDPDD